MKKHNHCAFLMILVLSAAAVIGIIVTRKNESSAGKEISRYETAHQ